MELAKDVYLNTDKVIIGEEYVLVYTGKYFKKNKLNKEDSFETILEYNGNNISMIKKDYGYISKIVINDLETDFKIIQNKEEDTFKIYGNEKPNILLEKEKNQMYLKVVPTKQELFQIKLINFIKQTIKNVPKLFNTNRLNIIENLKIENSNM